MSTSRSRLAVAVLGATLLAAPLAAGPGTQDAQNLRSAYGFGGMEAAEKTLDRLLSSAGGNADRLAEAGRALSGDPRLGKLATRLLDAAARLRPGSAGTHRDLSDAAANAGDFERAAEAMRAAIQAAELPLQDGEARIKAFVANALFDRGLRRLADELYREVANLPHPAVKRLEALLNPGQVRFGLVLSRETGGEVGIPIERVLDGTPASVAGVRAGDRLTKVGPYRVVDTPDAVNRLEAVPVGAEVRLMVRRDGKIVFLDTRKVDSAPIEEARRRNDQGMALASSGEMEAAVEQFRAATRAAPDDAKSWFNLGLASHRSGAKEAALAGYLAALSLGLDPSTSAKVEREVSGLRAELSAAASELFDPVARAQVDEGVALARTSRYAAALFRFLEALEREPGYPNARLGAGVSARALGLGSVAIRHLEAYLRIFPEAPNRREVERDLAELRAGVVIPPDQGSAPPAPVPVAAPAPAGPPPPPSGRPDAKAPARIWGQRR